MTASLFLPPRSVAISANSRVLSGAKRYFYLAGTNSPATVYTDASKSTTRTQPVVASSGGEFPACYVDVPVKVSEYTSSNVLRWTEDNIPVQVTEVYPALAGETGVSDTSWPPGDLRRYGAALDGVTSDHAAWGYAAAYAAAGGAPIYVPKSADGMATSEPLTVTSDGTTGESAGVVFEPGAFILYTGASDVAILTIGTATVVTGSASFKNIRVRRSAQSSWSSESNIGVLLQNLRTCDIEILEASNSTIGVQCHGNGYAFAGNTLKFGDIRNNKVAIDLVNTGSGYVNSNRYLGGYLANDTGVNATAARYGVRIRSVSDPGYYQNDNSFDGLTIELNTAGSGAAYPVLISHGQQNRFYNCRDELNDTPTVTTENDSADNVLEFNYGVPVLTQSGTYRNNYARNVRQYADQHFAPVWHSPPLHLRANEYDGSGACYFPGMSVLLTANGTIQRSGGSFTISDDYVSFDNGRAIGILIDTRHKKRFILRRDMDSSAYGGRWLVTTFDATMTQFTSAGAAHPYVLGDSGNTFSYISGFGGAYQSGGDGNGDFFLAVKDEVKFAWIGVSGGTNVARLRSIAIQSIDGGAITAFQGFTNGTVRHYNDLGNWASAPPANDIGVTYPVGMRIGKVTAASGGAPGWVCTTAGKGGTAVWKAEANLA